jgi:two-component system OmpR family sensor kinase
MKFNSIITNIKTAFAFTLLLFVLVYFAFLKYSTNEHLKQISNNYETMQNYIEVNRLKQADAVRYIVSLNFKIANNSRQIVEQAEYKINGRGFELIAYDKNLYLFLQTPYFRILFQDLNSYEQNYYGNLLFGALLIAFIFMYLWIMRALAPLKSLKVEMQKFANGELDINCQSDKKDEIAQLSNEFDKAVKKISLLIHSRQLFLRTVMHELKTPIAKGRIVCELIDDEKQKNRIIKIFEKLNHQINDFAKIEEIVSNNSTPHMNRCSVKAIIDKAVEMLMLENRENIVITNNIEIMIKADMDLIVLALKNLIDNALKYSNDSKVEIVSAADRIDIISYGLKLQKPLEEYYKPYHSDTENKNQGMGLGIYIVYSILQMHGMRLEYKYEENQNIFSVIYFH